MLEDFLDRPGQVQHEKFQGWRRGHDGAYFLSFRTKTKANLHINGGCHHLGNTEGGVEDAGYSNTASRKVCADDMGEITRWAADNGIEWRWC